MKDTKTYQTGFLFDRLGQLGLGGTVGGCGGQKTFSEIQPELVCDLLTRMAHATAPFLGSPPPGALGRGQRSNIIILNY